jgi:RNA polymerase sigma-70 factor (ECF subfamily)
LQAKLDASDLVQDTLLEAQVKFRLFHGSDEPQFVEWLRRILATKVANLVRHYCGTKMRDVGLEQEIDAGLDHSARMSHGLAASLVTASEQAARREEAVILADALARLPGDYQEVIKLRHFEGLTFPEIARTLDRTLDSIDKLWLRALTKLRQIVGESG